MTPAELDHCLLMLDLIPEEPEYQLEAIQWMIDTGQHLCYQRRFREANKVLNRCLELSTTIGSAYGQGWSKQYLGRIARDTSKLGEARQLYDDALALAEQESDFKLVAVIYDQIGTMFRLHGDMANAELYHMKAIPVCPDGAPYAIGNLATIEDLRGHPQKAAKLRANSIKIYQAKGNRRNESVGRVHQAVAYLSMLDYESAGRLALEAHRLAVETGHSLTAKEARGVFDVICSDLLEAEDGLPHFQAVLTLDWRDAEWEIKQGLLLNAFIHCSEKKDRFHAGAEMVWELVKLGTDHNVGILTAMRRQTWPQKQPLQRVNAALEREYRLELSKGGSIKLATVALALAFCQAAYGNQEVAVRLATEAEVLFSAGMPREAAKAIQLRDELRLLTVQDCP